MASSRAGGEETPTACNGGIAPTGHSHPKLAYAALAAVCIVWGTTYLGIRISLETLPPLYLIAIRYTISGGILLGACKLAGAEIPRDRELWLTAVCGAICIGIGNGMLAIAELRISSGLAALFYATAPFWMIAIDRCSATRGGIGDVYPRCGI